MATEETKPVEREAFDEWLNSFASSFLGHCSDENIFMAGEAWDAALERAARTVESTIWCYDGAQANDVRECAGKIRALKGSR